MAKEGAAVDGETNVGGNGAAKRRGRQLQRPLEFCCTCISHLEHNGSAAHIPPWPHVLGADEK